MAICETELTANIKRDCTKKFSRGVEERVYFGQLSHVSAIAFSSTNDQILTNFSLTSPKKLKVYEGYEYSNVPTTGFTRTEFGHSFPQTFRVVLFSEDPAAEAQIKALATLTDIFIVYKRRGITGDWKVMGFETGMRLTALEHNPNDEAQKGVYILTFGADDAQDLPYTLRHETSGTPDTRDFLNTMALA